VAGVQWEEEADAGGRPLVAYGEETKEEGDDDDVGG